MIDIIRVPVGVKILNLKQTNLFSTPVWIYDTSDNQLANKQFLESIYSGKLGSPINNSRSNRGGSRYEFDLMRDTPESIKIYILKCLKKLINEGFLLSIESWVNLHEYGGYNTSHIHPGYLISGVYYVQADSKSGSLVLEDPRPQSRYAANHVFLKDIDGQPEIKISPTEGKLILFPSWLAHHVTENQSPEKRVAISINVSAHQKPLQ
jgi:uncharacterized protein (TIGR02466 family)